jgi:AraC-like DNA-binding protein
MISCTRPRNKIRNRVIYRIIVTMQENSSHSDSIQLLLDLPVEGLQAGCLVSRGTGIHERRMLGEHELIFVRAGVLNIAEAGRPYRIEAGQSLILAPHQWHYGTAVYGHDLTFFWVHFKLGQYVGNRADLKATEVQIPRVATVDRPDYLAELYRRYIDDRESNSLDANSANLLVLLMLNEVRRSPDLTSSTGPAVLAAQAYRFICTNFHLPISASTIADNVGCNPQYLSRIYKDSYSSTLTDSIHRTRAEYACKLLLNSELRVNEIARACGMPDVGYFVKVFKRHKGVTPAAYRTLHARLYINTE